MDIVSLMPGDWPH